MSAPTFQALAMIALAASTVAACVLLRSREGLRKTAGVLTVLIGLLLFVFAWPSHLCLAGHPTSQALLGIACAAAVVLCVQGSRRAYGLAALIGLLTTGLMSQYQELVHHEGVTGNPRSHHNVRLVDLRARAREAIVELGKTDPSRYPEGRLSDIEAVRKAPGASPLPALSARFHRDDFAPWWHSWFTQLYERRETPIQLWYPGGTLSTAAPEVDWRECPGN